MKLTKKILLAATALLAASMVFTGCAEEEGVTGKIGKDFELTNTKSDVYVRGFSTTKTKHTSATAKITIQDTPSAYSGESGNGIVGFIFGVQDASDKVPANKGTTFGIAGIRRTSSTAAQAYVSWFENAAVPEKEGEMPMYKNGEQVISFPVAGADKYTPKGSAGSYEDAEVLDATNGFVNLPTQTANQPLKIWVKLEADGDDKNNNGKVEQNEGNGGYKVTFYSNTVDAKGKDIIGTAITNMSFTIPASNTKDSYAVQYPLGLYTCVYGYTGKTTVLKGRLDISDTINGVEVEITD